MVGPGSDAAEVAVGSHPEADGTTTPFFVLLAPPMLKRGASELIAAFAIREVRHAVERSTYVNEAIADVYEDTARGCVAAAAGEVAQVQQADLPQRRDNEDNGIPTQRQHRLATISLW